MHKFLKIKKLYWKTEIIILCTKLQYIKGAFITKKSNFYKTLKVIILTKKGKTFTLNDFVTNPKKYIYAFNIL